MDFQALTLPAVGLLLATSLILLLSRDWRWSVGALAGQYLGVFLLTALSWPLEMAVAKLVAGWFAGAVLGMTRVGIKTESETTSSRPSGRLFRLLAAALVLLAILSIAPPTVEWVPEIGLHQVVGGYILIGMGLLHLGLTALSMRVVLSLLTILSGFEILYAVVEDSTLVAGLLAVINLAIALVGAYLLSNTLPEEDTL